MRKILFVEGFQSEMLADGKATQNLYQDDEFQDSYVEPDRGWFHGFSQETFEEGPEPVVIIEREDGRLVTVSPRQCRFVLPGDGGTLT